MSTVYNYILPTGTIVPDTADIQTEVQNEYINAFGSALNVTAPNTPQGLLINAEVQSRIAAATNNATLANQINPNFAGGVFLDAILALMGSERLAATFSLVQCTVTGIFGTIIPNGSIAEDVNGNQWATIASTTIPLSGSISGVVFQSVSSGPIVATAGQINTIISNVLGWETVTNPSSSANDFIGQNTQTDVSARQYRINTLYLQSNGLAGSIIAALTATQTVNSLYFIENPSSSPTTIQGVSMNANSIYCCIDGTDQAAIAAALTATKSAGCAYTHGASMTPISYAYTVPISGQVINVLWDSPDLIQIGVQISVILNTPIQDYITTITDAILTYASGGVSGLPGLKVGLPVSPFEISAAVGIQYPGVFVANCSIAKLTFLTLNGTLTNTSPSVTGISSTTNLRTGMPVSGTGIPTGTKILTINSSTSITLSANATTSGIESLTFYNLYQTGTVSSGTNTITGLTDAETLFYVGMTVSDFGVNIPANTTIISITNNTTVVMSANATGNATETIVFLGNYVSELIGISPWELAQIQAANITVSLA